MNEEIRKLLDEALEEERKENGKRFSTHYEAHARIREQVEDAMDNVSDVANGMSALWSMLKAGRIDKDYAEMIMNIRSAAYLGACDLVRVYMLCEKLDGGVVHEPRKDE